MHISLWLMMIGFVGYFLNMTIINHFIKIKAYQTQVEKRVERRRSSENRKVKGKADEKLMKQVPKLKWTVWFGFFMFLTFAVGLVWAILRLVGLV